MRRQAQKQNTPLSRCREGVGAAHAALVARMEPPGPASGRPDDKLRVIRESRAHSTATPGLRDRRRSLHPGYVNYIAMAIFPKCRLAFIISNPSATCATANAL